MIRVFVTQGVTGVSDPPPPGGLINAHPNTSAGDGLNRFTRPATHYNNKAISPHSYYYPAKAWSMTHSYLKHPEACSKLAYIRDYSRSRPPKPRALGEHGEKATFSISRPSRPRAPVEHGKKPPSPSQDPQVSELEDNRELRPPSPPALDKELQDNSEVSPPSPPTRDQEL
jgi:hypothetical protein